MTTSRILNGTITANDIGDDAVGAAELAGNAVAGSNVISESLTFSDIAGGDADGAVSFPSGAVAAGRCANYTFSIGGAMPGDNVVFSMSDDLPSGVFPYGQRVSAANQVEALLCNLSGAAIPAITDAQV